MDLSEIKSLIAAMAASDLSEMEISKNGWTLRLVRRANAGVPLNSPPGGIRTRASVAPGAAPVAGDDLTVRAPLAGTAFLPSAPGEPAFVAVGQAVKAGESLCVIEAMKVFNAVKAERDGIVEAVLVASGDEVEAGQPLLRVA